MEDINSCVEALDEKVKQVGQDFINQLFSGIPPQELKKLYVEKEPL